MTTNYRDKLFETYNATHVVYVDIDNQAKLKWFQSYAKKNYLGFIKHFDRESTRVLDIGCNQGFLLAVLESLGFTHLSGIDLSPVDLEKAKKVVPNATLDCIDAFDYLKKNPATFDIIFIKAVVEHIQKDKIIPLFECIKESLKLGGIVVVDVPNMDWVFAQHERYMDFTHEVGFTRESLSQVMRNVFDEVTVVVGRPLDASSPKEQVKLWLRPFVIKFFNLLFKIVGEGAHGVWWHSRSIIGVGKK